MTINDDQIEMVSKYVSRISVSYMEILADDPILLNQANKGANIGD